MGDGKPKSARVSEIRPDIGQGSNLYNEIGDDSNIQDIYYNQDQEAIQRTRNSNAGAH